MDTTVPTLWQCLSPETIATSIREELCDICLTAEVRNGGDETL